MRVCVCVYGYEKEYFIRIRLAYECVCVSVWFKSRYILTTNTYSVCVHLIYNLVVTLVFQSTLTILYVIFWLLLRVICLVSTKLNLPLIDLITL